MIQRAVCLCLSRPEWVTSFPESVVLLPATLNTHPGLFLLRWDQMMTNAKKKKKKKGCRYAENKHLRENSCLVKGHSPTVPRALSPFPASRLQDPSPLFLSTPTRLTPKSRIWAFFLTHIALTPSALHLEDSWQSLTTL